MPFTQRVTYTQYAIPPGHSASNPFQQFPSVGWCWMHKLVVRCPAGHNGWTGYRLDLNGITVIPWANTSGGPYYVSNDETVEWPLDVELDAHMAFKMLNNDIYSHTLYLRFFWTPISLVTQATEMADLLAIT